MVWFAIMCFASALLIQTEWLLPDASFSVQVSLSRGCYLFSGTEGRAQTLGAHLLDFFKKQSWKVLWL